MAYSINPYLPKARAAALKLLLIERLPLAVVAVRCGVHRSTIWRWKRKWEQLNEHRQLTNSNRPSRAVGHGHLRLCRWLIATDSSRPHSHPHAVSQQVVRLVLRAREILKRCAEVVWHHVTQVLGVTVSLSSVRRILRRYHYFDGARKPRVRRDNPRRPVVTQPGELVQTDTIHHVDPHTGRRLYYYTVIDLYSRMAHVTLAATLSPGLAAQAVIKAQEQWGFSLAMVQSDNGPEYRQYFTHTLQRAGIQTRHSRLGRPNDNAHIERFNRTIQTECIGHHWNRSVPLQSQQDRLDAYLEYYNHKRVHLGIQLRTPTEMLQRL
ncbi:MAG: integrase core domain-containing protein [Candidatus Saccharimonas sp.]